MAARRDGGSDTCFGADPRRDHGDCGVFPGLPYVAAYEFAPEAKALSCFLGARRRFFAATVGLVQNDIKRVIAYSTCSQLGLYVRRCWCRGLFGGDVPSADACVLSRRCCFWARVVIHAMHHEQDMRNYGGLRKKIPYTFWAMMIGTLAITGVGIPLTHMALRASLSKDAVIESAWAGTAGRLCLLAAGDRGTVYLVL